MRAAEALGEDDTLRLAAAVERDSEHPVAGQSSPVPTSAGSMFRRPRASARCPATGSRRALWATPSRSAVRTSSGSSASSPRPR
jgi:hypothetical protein